MPKMKRVVYVRDSNGMVWSVQYNAEERTIHDLLEWAAIVVGSGSESIGLMEADEEFDAQHGVITKGLL